MSAIEINKFIGALLGTVLFLMLINMLADAIFSSHHTKEKPAYIVANTEPQHEPSHVQEDVGPTLDVLLANADTASGKKISKKCIACHTFSQGQASKIGPNLWDIIGRDIASGPSFAYSNALLSVEGKWNFFELDRFLTSPKKFASGTKMAFPGLKKPSDRADVVMYLRSLSPTPVAISSD
jgi:cytochrome c